MNPDYPFVKPRRHPNSLALVVRLRGSPTRRQQRAFFSRLHQEARRLGLVMARKFGLCIFLGAERICGSAHRHQLVGWLIDQKEVADVVVGKLEHLADLKIPLPDERERPSYMPDEAETLHRLIEQVTFGVIKQWTGYVFGLLA